MNARNSCAVSSNETELVALSRKWQPSAVLSKKIISVSNGSGVSEKPNQG